MRYDACALTIQSTKMTQAHSVFSQTLLWTALITPMLPDGEVDFASLRRMVQHQNQSKTGLLVLGSTGEQQALNLDEKEQVLAAVIEANQHAPIMVGVPNTAWYDTEAWLQRCRSMPIDALLAAPTAYNKPGPNAQVQWFRKIVQHSDLPLMLYEIPSRTGAALAPHAMETLAAEQPWLAVKESGGQSGKHLHAHTWQQFGPVYCGDDGNLVACMEAGYQGLISVLSNAWPQEIHAWVQYLHRAKKQNPPPSWQAWWQAIQVILQQGANPIPIKQLLQELQLIQHAATRFPLTPLDGQPIPEINTWCAMTEQLRIDALF